MWLEKIVTETIVKKTIVAATRPLKGGYRGYITNFANGFLFWRKSSFSINIDKKLMVMVPFIWKLSEIKENKKVWSKNRSTVALTPPPDHHHLNILDISLLLYRKEINTLNFLLCTSNSSLCYKISEIISCISE